MREVDAMTSVHSYQSRDDVDSEMMMIGEDLQVAASTLEVDYDKNLTELYQAITDQDWTLAASICKKDPIQAAIWVVRHYSEDNNENQSSSVTSPQQDPEIMWRFLPLHSACARQPPYDTLVALLNAYSDAAKCVDDQGMYALHYACGNQADESAIRLLLNTFLKAASIPDPRGMLPLHYTACWGPSSTALNQGVLNQLINAYPAALNMRDYDGNTPLDLAMDGDYAEKLVVADTLRQWAKKQGITSSNNSTTSSHTPSKVPRIRKTGSNGSDYFDAIVIESKKSTIRLDAPEMISTESNKVVKNIVTAGQMISPSVEPTPRSGNQQTHQHELRVSPPLIPARSVSKSPSPGQPSVTCRNFKPDEDVEVVVPPPPAVNVNRYVADDEEKGSLQHELHAVMAKLHAAQDELNGKSVQISELEQELDSTKVLLEESRLECSDLKHSLNEITEQHDNGQRKSANTHDRLSTLSISLESMKEQQSILTKIVSERNGHYQNITVKRQELFDQLLKMDLDIADNESHIDASLKKQTREMEAISAVINAALD